MKLDKEPLVSVIMPVYNAEKDLREAINSILNQTYKNIELIIIDDASTDGSADIISSYSDDRIIFVRNKTNMKQQYTRNLGLTLAKGTYIANMDADDISMPDRIYIQVQYMEEHDDIDICGTSYWCFDDCGREYVVHQPGKTEILCREIMTKAVIAHPTVMFRKSSVCKFKIHYDVNNIYNYAEDFELFSRLSLAGAKISNIDIPLLKYRLSDYGISRTREKEQGLATCRVIQRNLDYIFGENVISVASIPFEGLSIAALSDVLQRMRLLYEQMPESKIFTNDECKQIIISAMMVFLLRHCFLGKSVYLIMIMNLPKFHRIMFSVWGIKFFIKCFISYGAKK